MPLNTKDYRIDSNKTVKLAAFPTRYEGKLDKEEALALFAKLIEKFKELQALLYADGGKALLVVLQAMDAAGKDSTIRNVFGPINPQGCKVVSFKSPNAAELAHDFLWRIHQNIPRKGHIGVFNRSHYEDVLIARVKELVPKEQLKKRYTHINNFESLLTDEGTRIVKFFLHISPDYQKEQLQERLDTPEKLWKFSPSDIPERMHWDEYQKVYETAIEKCSSPESPWYIVPAERKWFRNLLVVQVLVDTLASMNLKYPEVTFNPKEIKIP
ncbi:MAG: polyphosphate kinase 2 family protein [Spirochaetales bacterium]|jgi:PPK2 family polyphosphate:nucleotide phosphotransferase|nr:polyphosphate kinase 2 family protein [Spirochaetales bacterium]